MMNECHQIFDVEIGPIGESEQPESANHFGSDIFRLRAESSESAPSGCDARAFENPDIVFFRYAPLQKFGKAGEAITCDRENFIQPYNLTYKTYTE